jgi:hypothetical protein
VTHYLREAIFVSSNSPVNISEIEPQFNDCDQGLLLALAEQSFASIQELVRLVHLPRTSVQRCLTQSFGFHVRHLRWVPHLLSHSQKLDRLTLSQQPLPVLERQERQPWHDMVTLDESWFYLNMEHEPIWLQPDEKIPETDQHTVQSEK